MSNLQNNIASLEALITKANALPEEKTIQSSKAVTPTTSSQTVKPDSGYDGLGQVVVNAMPTGSVGTPSISIDANGKITATAAVDAGYVDGTDKTGTKTMTTQAAKTVTPTKSSQTAVAKNVYTTGVVTVGAIPDKYQDVSGVTATAATTLTGSKFVNSSGTLTSGTMPNNGTLSSTIDGLETTSVSIPKGYTDGGTVALDSTIDTTANSQAVQIAEIKAMLEGKSVSGGGSSGDSIETCTVEINNNSSSYSSVYYTTVDANGKLVSVYNGSNNAYQRTINNVVCGSCVVVYTSASKFTTTNCEVLFQTTTAFYVVHITASAGEIAKVTSTMSGGGSGN